MSNEILSEILVTILKNGEITGDVHKFQYYPSPIFNPDLSLFADEMKRQLNFETNNFWIYFHDVTRNELILLYSQTHRIDNTTFRGCIKYGALRVYIEIAKQLNDNERRFSLPKMPGIRSINELKTDRTNDYDKHMAHLVSMREELENILRGTDMHDELLRLKSAPKKPSSNEEVRCAGCGKCVTGLLEKCVECGFNFCADCIPVMRHKRYHKSKVIYVACQDECPKPDAPVCIMCGGKVSSLYYIDLRTFYACCNEHGETMIARGNAMESDLFRVHCTPIFKYQSTFLKLKKEFSYVGDERIKQLLYLNDGCEDNVRCVLMSPYQMCVSI